MVFLRPPLALTSRPARPHALSTVGKPEETTMTKVQEKMTVDPVICESTDTLADAAQLMRDRDP
jgi:hypothetical protein